jgi:Electron transfer DM13
MNAQRWIALAIAVVIVSITATNGLWGPLLERSKPAAATATPRPAQQAAEVASSPTITSGLRQTQVLEPTLDPITAGLMAETGLKTLAVGDNPVIILGGEFTIVDELHRATGTASIYKLGDKKRALRLDPFEGTNGPELHVILSQFSEPRTSADALLPIHFDLGVLKSPSGAQNYDVPDNVNLDDFKSVVIYSISLNLVFSSAPLKQVRG